MNGHAEFSAWLRVRRCSPWRDRARPEGFGVSLDAVAFRRAGGESVREVLAPTLRVASDLHAIDLAGLLAVGAIHGRGLVSPPRVVEMARALAEAAGTSGVVGGSVGRRR